VEDVARHPGAAGGEEEREHWSEDDHDHRGSRGVLDRAREGESEGRAGPDRQDDRQSFRRHAGRLCSARASCKILILLGVGPTRSQFC
jgi:hypothetical protein